MSSITVGRENSTTIDLYYEDHGSGPPVVLIHGWPLDGRSWEAQLHALLAAGYRVISYDRRGFGRSSRPSSGYDFDTLCDDLDVLLNHLDLYDVTLVGFSLGTGELARYIGTRGTRRLRSCVFIESLAPSFVRSDDNPRGVDEAAVEAVQQLILQDRPAWLAGALKDFLNLDDYLGSRVSDEMVRSLWNAGNEASPVATWACPRTWLEDYERDIVRIDIPTLIVHGTADRILSIEGQARRLHAALPHSSLVEIDGGPHFVCVTHAAEVNEALLAFLNQPVPTAAQPGAATSSFVTVPDLS
jgi:non-heme chloroperoxidase